MPEPPPPTISVEQDHGSKWDVKEGPTATERFKQLLLALDRRNSESFLIERFTTMERLMLDPVKLV